MREKLNWFHVMVLVYMIEFDITAFSLARVIAENIGTNGWLALILLSIAASFNIFLYWAVYRVAKGKSFFQIMESFIPRGPLVPVYLGLAAFWVLLGSLIGKNFVIISQMLSFQSTHPMYIFLLYCLLIYAMLVKDLYSIVKATTVFFLLTFWMNALVPYFFSDWKAVRLTPFIFQGSEHGHSLHGWAEVYMVFVGYELCLFLFPHSDRKTKLFRGVLLGHLLISAAYVTTVLVTYGFFSFEQLKELQFPLINTLEYLELPFLNRLENMVFTFFLFSNLVTTVMFCFASLSTLKHVFPRAKGKTLETVIICLVFVSGFLTKTVRESDELLRALYFTEMALAFGLPLLLIPMAYFANRKEKGAEA